MYSSFIKSSTDLKKEPQACKEQLHRKKIEVEEFPYSEKFLQNLPSALIGEGSLLKVEVKVKTPRLLMHPQGLRVWSSL